MKQEENKPNNKEKILMNDTMFKYFLKSKKYRYWIYEIIKEKTGIDLEEYELYDNEENTGNNVKDYRMDAVYEKEREKVIVEINSGNPKESRIKMYYYAHRVQGSQIKEGEKYRSATTTLIAFNNYRNPEIPRLAIGYYKLTEQQTKIPKEDDLQVYEIALPIFHEKEYNEIKEEMDKRLWIMGVKDMEEARTSLDLNDKNIKIIEEYERLIKEDDRFVHVYNVEEEHQRMLNTAHACGYEEGEEAGIKTGKKQANRKMAKSMLKDGIDRNAIAKYTNLSLEEIENLK